MHPIFWAYGRRESSVTISWYAPMRTAEMLNLYTCLVLSQEL